MEFDFDTQLELRGTHCSKHDHMERAFKLTAADAIPMWVADMEFAAAPPILETLRAEVDRGYMGYFGDVAPVTNAVTGWMERQHGLTMDPDHVRFTRGVIEGIGLALETLTERGDGVIVFSPVYHMFYKKVAAMERQIVESPLEVENGRFVMDLDGLQSQLSGQEKVVIFCSPHNPGGRLWAAEEIRALVDFCARNGLWLISDEIHMDLTHPGATHVSTLVAAPDAADRTIVLSAASKGFNIAGGETAFAYVPDPKMRSGIDAALAYMGGTPNRLGMLMTKAAFTRGADWSQACRAYIADNFTLWRDRIGALPGIGVMDMQATYLSWVDFSGTGLTTADVTDRVIQQAHIAPSPGRQFGTGGEAHRRFNVAMPRPTLETAISRLEKVFADLQ